MRWWTVQCPFCRDSLPDLAELHRRFSPRGSGMVGVFHPKMLHGPTDAETVAYARGLGFPGAVAADDRWVAGTAAAAGRAGREVSASAPPAPTDPLIDPARNSYESYVVRASGSPPGFLARDPDHSTTPPTPTILPGPPVNPSSPYDDLLDLYPRIHLLGDGTMFLSGYAPLSSKIDLDLPLGSRPWDQTIGRNFMPAWPRIRYNGASVFFARVGALRDVVVRLGGAWFTPPNTDPLLATDTMEFCLATVPNSGWSSLPSIPGGPRESLNAVILPDASILVIGGLDPAHLDAPVYETAVYRPGIGWQTPPPSPARRKYHATARDYHATGVLLDDGRMLIGGGEGRTFDYQIYNPPYMTLPRPPGVTTNVPQQFPWMRYSDDAPGTVYGVNWTNVLPPTVWVEKVVLMAPGSVTHHSDMHQRYVELTSYPPDAEEPGGFDRLFVPPKNSKHAPRGWYMLCLVTNQGAPSEAVWVYLQ
jgi:hypothetical protein